MNSKKLAVALAVLFVFIGLGSPAEASVPVCQLGGPTAMDPNRKLAEGEKFVLTDRPVVMNLAFKPTKAFPYRAGECLVLPGTKVAVKNGVVVWVAECGNDELNQNIPMGPRTPIGDAVRGLQGPMGPQGPQGPAGRDGRDGADGADGDDAPERSGFHCGTTCKVLVGAVLLGGGYVVYDQTRDNDKFGIKTGPTRDNKCVATGTGPTNCKTPTGSSISIGVGPNGLRRIGVAIRF